MSDLSLFLGQLIRRPTEIRAIAPTASAAAHEMARCIRPEMEAVAEIGAGTGTITRAILARGLPPARLELYELNAAFCARLRDAFPGVTVHNRPAQDMVNVGRKNLDAVISGVPTLWMLKPGAPFVQITYGTQPPLSERVREDLGLSFTRSRRIWRNLPPAQVYAFRQVDAG